MLLFCSAAHVSLQKVECPLFQRYFDSSSRRITITFGSGTAASARSSRANSTAASCSSARAFSNGAEQLDQAIAKMAGLAKAYPEGVPTDDPTLQKIRKQLQETFGKFSKAEQALWKELSK